MEKLADIALLVDAEDEPVRCTLSETMWREGWRVARVGEPAACAVVVWTDRSIQSQVLAVSARPFLDRRRLLQVLLLPDSRQHGQPAAIEPPEPFVYFQNLVTERATFAIDRFDYGGWEGSVSERILAELARLGRLPRPRDRSNSRVVFLKHSLVSTFRFREVFLVEQAAGDGQILRRIHISTPKPQEEDFETTIGNRWQVLDPKMVTS